MNNKQEYILCATIHFDDLTIYAHQPNNIQIGYVICGFRHDNCILQYLSLSTYRPTKVKQIQGFLTSKNRFVSREDAAKIAFEAGQVKYLSDGLISEELY